MLGKEEIVSPALDELKEHYQRIITLSVSYTHLTLPTTSRV